MTPMVRTGKGMRSWVRARLEFPGLRKSLFNKPEWEREWASPRKEVRASEGTQRERRTEFPLISYSFSPVSTSDLLSHWECGYQQAWRCYDKTGGWGWGKERWLKSAEGYWSKMTVKAAAVRKQVFLWLCPASQDNYSRLKNICKYLGFLFCFVLN